MDGLELPEGVPLLDTFCWYLRSTAFAEALCAGCMAQEPLPFCHGSFRIEGKNFCIFHGC